MRKFLMTALLLSGPLMAHPYHSDELSTPLYYLHHLEESKQLIEQVEQEGAIAIKVAKLGANASNALWMPSERTIYLNVSHRRSYGNMMRSILFELHNALSERQFDYYDQMARERQISKEKYIEAIEYIEYSNVLKTVQVLNKGIRRGVFPPDAHWEIARSFDEHYQFQLEFGHTALIGHTYDSIMREHPRAIAKKW